MSASTGIQGATGIGRHKPSTGIQGLTGLAKSKATVAPTSTPIYEGGSNKMTWPWATFFDSLNDSTNTGSGGSGTQGATGPAGPIGPIGLPGITGAQGPAGSNGATGVSGDTGLQGTTGLANFIENGFTGITNTPVLLYSFQDEALYMGVTGVSDWVQIGAGSQGVTGPIGSTGLQGAQGSTGIEGPAGLTGAPGITGSQGPTGVQGITGEAGLTGITYGATGVAGQTGVQGLTGLANFIEDDFPVITATPQFLWNFADESLYLGITGADGNWVQLGAGCQGVTGAGIQGVTGAGVQGATGLKGATGIQGQGSTGIQGQTGLKGSTGVKGTTGAKGATGLAGLTGLANFIQDDFPAINAPPQLLWNFKDESLYLGVTGLNGNWVELGAGCKGVTGLQGNTGAQGSNIRSFTWVFRYPVSGGVVGPRLYEDMTALSISSFVTSATNVVFNVQDRTSCNSTGLNLMASNQTATVTGVDSTTLQNVLCPAKSWLYLNIVSVSGTPSALSVTVAGRV